VTPARPARHLRPTKENRKQAVELISTGLIQTRPQFEQSCGWMREDLAKEVSKPDSSPSSIAIGAAQLFFNEMGVAVAKVLARESGGWQQLDAAFAHMYWGWELGQHQWLLEGRAFTESNGEELDLLQFHALASAMGADEISDWVGRYLFNHLSAGGIDEALGEQDYIDFYWRIVAAQFTRQWPTPDKLTDDLGEFRSLLLNASDAGRRTQAVLDYCDFRLSRSFQFQDREAKRPRDRGDPMYVFETQWIALLPLELLALQRVSKSVAGIDLDLAVGHPLLETPLAHVPPFTSLRNDAVTDMLQKYGQQKFGASWRPLTLLPLQEASTATS
jgi:hypothetical protein